MSTKGGYSYLGSIYTGTTTDKYVWAERELKVSHFTQRLTVERGEVIFSPLTHSVPLANRFGLPHSYEFWQKIDHAFIRNADSLYVLMLDQWHTSTGLKDEYFYARSLGKPVFFFEYESLEPIFNIRQSYLRNLRWDDSNSPYPIPEAT